MSSFEGKVVLISGAAGGFGRAAAEMFSSEGAKLVLTDRNADDLVEVTKGLSGEVRCLAGDVTDETLAVKLVALAFDEFGGLDIAVNNAGIAQPMLPISKTPTDLFHQVIDVDLYGVFYAMRAQLKAMDKQFKVSGRTSVIINVSSIAGVVAAPLLGAYAAAKHAVVGLTRTAAVEHARRGVRVNAICPSFARTPMVMDDILNEGGDTAEARLTVNVPMGRLGEVSEIMAGLRYLADPANSFVTGQTIQIDGGMTAA